MTPAGVATYSQAGQNYGTSLLWVLPLLIPVLVVNQEMVVRLGAVTGVGHGRLIKERFGRFWAGFSVGDLFILDFLTIVTEFIGVALALGYFGVSDYISVPIAAFSLVAMTATGSFRRWERFMLVFRSRQFPGHPARRIQPPPGRPGAARAGRARDSRRGQLHLCLADHRHSRYYGGALAAVLPAVQHRGQADHAALDQLRAGRHRAGFFRDGHRGRPDRRHVRLCLHGHPLLRQLHRRRRGGVGLGPRPRTMRPAPYMPSSC